MQQQEVKFLSGKRWNEEANEQFRMVAEDFENVEFESSDWIDILQSYINMHKSKQVPRLKELKRYYNANNNIKYRPPKADEFAADNRIASDFARFITVFEQGYMLGKPVIYKNEDENLQEKIDEFSIKNNEEHHNVMIKTDLSIYGRAYELIINLEEDGNLNTKLIKFNTEQTFVVYDDSYNNNSLFAVNYYTMKTGVGKRKDFVFVYTSDRIYQYENDHSKDRAGLYYVDEEQHYFDGVPVTEFNNNEDRRGAYESVLDSIDAYDLSQSELANFQQDSNDAMLVISGNPYTGAGEEDFNEDGTLNPNGRLAISRAFRKAKMLILDDNPTPNGSKPDAKYLVKEYDTEGVEKYKQRIVDDILRFTFTPDTTDENFSGVRSGESMKYKLMASDNLRAEQERMFKKGLMRRLRLVANIWKIRGNEATPYELINQTSVVFTPNAPANNVELVESARKLYGMASDRTVFETLSQVTGVEADEELRRLEDE